MIRQTETAGFLEWPAENRFVVYKVPGIFKLRKAAKKIRPGHLGLTPPPLELSGHRKIARFF